VGPATLRSLFSKLLDLLSNLLSLTLGLSFGWIAAYGYLYTMRENVHKVVCVFGSVAIVGISYAVTVAIGITALSRRDPDTIDPYLHRIMLISICVPICLILIVLTIHLYKRRRNRRD
jgi:Na+-driven multidrug efflux pump